MATQTSRLSALITAIGADIKAAFKLRNNPNTDLDGSDDKVIQYTVVDDGTSTGSWPNRLAFLFKPSGGTAKLVTWLNEYGELRVTPGKVNTVGVRFHSRNAVADTAHSGYIMDVELARDDATVLFGIDEQGTQIRGELRRTDDHGTRDQLKTRKLTQSAYDGLSGGPDPNVIYFIVG